MVTTCWRLSPWCLRHRHTSPRFFSPQLPPSSAHHAALYFWMQKWPHRAPINIFASLKIKEGFVYVYFSAPGSPVGGAPLWLQLHAVESSPVHLFVWMSALHLLLCPQVHGLHVLGHVSVKSSMDFRLLASILNKQTHFTFLMSAPSVVPTEIQGLYGLYQCLKNARSSTSEECVFQFCSRITTLLSFHFVCLAQIPAPRWFMVSTAVLDLVRLGFLWYLPAHRITKDVDWGGIMMIHLPIMLPSRGVISSSIAVLGPSQLFNIKFNIVQLAVLFSSDEHC